MQEVLQLWHGHFAQDCHELKKERVLLTDIEEQPGLLPALELCVVY
jgi:hypothetical protein